MSVSFIVFYFFVCGLIIGSFLNVVVYRLREQETLLGRSFCRSCQHQIRWYDNIPLISFLILGGKCRDCRAAFSWQYPILELVTALCFAFIGQYFFQWDRPETWLETGFLVGITSLLLVIAAYDLIHMEIPITILMIGFGWTVLFLLLDMQDFRFFLWDRQVQALLGALVVGALFFALVFISHETWMGWGDVWLGALAGLIVGLSGALFMMTLSFGSGALVGILLMILNKKNMKSQIPFAPYLVLGTLLTLFLPHMFPEYIARMLL